MKIAQHGVTLRGVKYAAFASEETNCFSATVYIHGKKVGAVSNSGTGGADKFVPWALRDELDKIASTLPDIVCKRPGSESDEEDSTVLKMDAELLIGELFEAFLVEKELKRLLKSTIVFRSKDNRIRSLGKLSPQVLANSLKAGEAYILGKIPDAAVVLNCQPLEVALRHYMECA